MRRLTVPARDNWQRVIESDGLVYWKTLVDGPNGQEAMSYWCEDACYEIHENRIDELEKASGLVLEALVEAVDHAFANPRYLDLMGVPERFRAAIRRTWDAEWVPSVYGRFDVCWDGTENSDPKFLEFNADTPTSLLETAVQWRWFDERYGPAGLTPNSGFSQWNLVYETLLAQWTFMKAAFIRQYGHLPTLHYSCIEGDESGEDRANVEYMAEIARQAGWRTEFVYISDLNYEPLKKSGGQRVPLSGRFYVGTKPVEAIFKLYPWEAMWAETPGCDRWLENSLLEPDIATTWMQPPYAGLFSNKLVWALAWKLRGNDSEVGKYLLPTFYEKDRERKSLTSYATKPILAREGSGIRLYRDGQLIEKIDGPYNHLPKIWQALHELPDFDGNHPVLGVWMLGSPEGDIPAGLGIRESKGLITGNTSRFVPHRVKMRDSGLLVTGK